MRGLSIATAAILLLTATARTQAVSFISRAIFADGKLWLLEEDGGLSTLVKDHPRTPVALDQPALDLIRDRNNPVIVSCDGKTCENWLVRRWTNGQWKIEAKIATAGDRLMALANGDHIVLVTGRRIVDLRNGLQKTTEYKTAQQPSPNQGRITSTAVTATHVWIGRDAGEWGGSLERIDLSSGASKDIKGDVPPFDPNKPSPAPPPNFSANQGPIISNVNGLLPEPWNPRCLLVAQGLVHFMAMGEIVQVCGDKVLPFYRADLKGHLGVPFYGLAKARNGNVWAAGIDGVYSLGRDGRGQRIPMPRFVTTGGASVGFATPDLALVLTDMHRHASVSGSAPMLVPLDSE